MHWPFFLRKKTSPRQKFLNASKSEFSTGEKKIVKDGQFQLNRCFGPFIMKELKLHRGESREIQEMQMQEGSAPVRAMKESTFILANSCIRMLKGKNGLEWENVRTAAMRGEDACLSSLICLFIYTVHC